MAYYTTALDLFSNFCKMQKGTFPYRNVCYDALLVCLETDKNITFKTQYEQIQIISGHNNL